ncbi:MAG: glutamate--tRNA ligase, partial [Lachnospiraceae bacterium]|nr:glutamate--tRNA ligase [Lachnospiraceae bacterium]
YAQAKDYLKEALPGDYDEEKIRKVAAMVKTRIEVFPDIAGQVDFLSALPEYDPEMYVHKKMKTDRASSLEVLKEVLPILEGWEDYTNDALYARLLQYVEEKGVKNGYVMWPIRTALSGKQMTPAGATEILELLGKEESLKRIREGIRLLEQ